LALSTLLLDECTYYHAEANLQRHVARNSTRLSQRAVSCSELLFYQPAVTDPGGDYRLNSATVLAFKRYQHRAMK
jgi:hypothetical protein